VILADFIEGARTRYSLTRAPIVIDFSNGAIIMAAALLLTRPGLLAGAILFRRRRHSGATFRPVWTARRFWPSMVRRTPGDHPVMEHVWPSA